MDNGRREVLRILGDTGDGLFDLRSGLSLQPRLSALAEQDPSSPDGFFLEAPDAPPRWHAQGRRAATAELVVGIGSAMSDATAMARHQT